MNMEPELEDEGMVGLYKTSPTNVIEAANAPNTAAQKSAYTTPAFVYECLQNGSVVLGNLVRSTVEEAAEVYLEEIEANLMEGEFIIRRINDWTDQKTIEIKTPKPFQAHETRIGDLIITVFDWSDTEPDSLYKITKMQPDDIKDTDSGIKYIYKDVALLHANLLRTLSNQRVLVEFHAHNNKQNGEQ